MLLALFLLETGAGLYIFLPLVGRRNAGVKFYRLILVICGSLAAAAAAAHGHAGAFSLAAADASLLVGTGVVYLLLRFPKRLLFRVPAACLGVAQAAVTVSAFSAVIRPPSLIWSLLGGLSSAALLGSVNLAMLLGHWYLVVRGMPIEPLSRLTTAVLWTTISKIAVVAISIGFLGQSAFEHGEPLYRLIVTEGIFFWMRVGWGLAGPIGLYPMVRGTVRLRSTMAATGILYVAVVAVVIGEVLAAYLSSLMHLPT